jgi:hypothetical protein
MDDLDMFIWREQRRNVIAVIVFVAVIWAALRITAPADSRPALAPVTSDRPGSGPSSPGLSNAVTCPPSAPNEAAGCVTLTVSTGR